MVSFFISLYDFFHRHRWLLAILVLSITGIFVFLTSRIRLEEDITRFIPTDDKVKKYADVFRNIRINDKLVVAIYMPDSSASPDHSQLISFGDELVASMREKYMGTYIREITYRLSGDMMSDMYDLFYRHLPYFFEEADYAAMDSMLSMPYIEKTIKRDYRTLISPAGVVFRKYIARDPLGLTPLAIKKISYMQVQDNFEIYNDCIFTKDGRNLLLFINSASRSNETSKNTKLINGLDEEIKRISEHYRNKVTAGYFGAVAVAVGNAKQMKTDTMVTMTIAMVLLLLLLLFFFRKLKILLYIMLPIIMGALFSLAMIYLIKGEISTLAIAAGSIILGIAMNYSTHYFAHLKHVGSPRETIRDLTSPMTIGSFTTIGAFLSLLFVKSEALNDFGLFSALILIGAVLFSLIVLPHLLGEKTSVKEAHLHHVNFLERFSGLSFEKSIIFIVLIIVLSVIFFFTSQNVGFESDLTKMNYEPANLRATERRLSQITDSSLRAVYVVSTGSNLNNALKRNETMVEKLSALKKQNKLHSFTSPGTLLLSDSVKNLRALRWQAFWTEERKDTLMKRLELAGIMNNFREDAFKPFVDFISTAVKPMPQKDIDRIRKIFLEEYITERADQTMVITLIKAREKDKDGLISSLPKNDYTTIIDRQFMASQFSNVINNDFNIILWITSLLVLGFLILTYGRLELGLISFIPMLLSMIWICGIMGILGMNFNIFSIVISAFIFGLGDDYSIFMIDGLMLEYKTGKKNLASYKTAVLLSALTTVIGIGVLIFAKHPALRSIAVTTIVGMLSVVFISYTVPPAIFHWMIMSGNKKRTFPVTLGGLIYALVFYSWFIGGCIFTVLTGWTVIRILPVGRKKRRLVYHYLLYAVCRSTIYIMFMAKKRFINLNRETFKKPAVVICNHQSLIDIPLSLMFTPKMAMITRDELYNSFFLGRLIKQGAFFSAAHGYDEIWGKLKELVADGYSIFVFPEGTRSENHKPGRFHKGAFYLAEQLGIDVLPMVMSGTGDYIKKGEYFGRRSTIAVKFLDRISANDTRYGTNYSERTKSVQKVFHEEFYKLRGEIHGNPDYHRDLLIRNFIYKGPVLEWYARIKLRLEKNYRFFNELLPVQGQITDIGCGYGFLSYMLAYVSPLRKVTGIDYDEEKVDVANMGISRPANTEFFYGDALDLPLPRSHAFVLADVLHYMPEEHQHKLIRKCTENLEADGIIIIRDADASLEKKHKGTKLTEFFSTKVLGFNKTRGNNQLFFTSRDTVYEALKGLDFSVEMVDETRFTSNVYYIIRSNGGPQAMPLA